MANKSSDQVQKIASLYIAFLLIEVSREKALLNERNKNHRTNFQEM